MTIPITTHTLAVPGARLHYEVRGDGPLLAVIGSPMAAADFAPLADTLATRFTVVTYDPRGIGSSAVDDRSQGSAVEVRADDVAAVLDAVAAGPVDVFGSSGGAVVGLALVARHRGRVRTLVAHEPPLLDLLPDAADRHAETDDIVDTFHRDGQGAAWLKFMTTAGFDVGGDGAPTPPPGEPSPQDVSNAEWFFTHELRPTTRYLPDVAALRSTASRVVVGVGAASRRLVTYRTSLALCELLGTPPVEFPGDHGGFLSAPTEFAEKLTQMLS